MAADRETWKFINTFAPWLSAFGTLLAVIVSLLLARRSTAAKVQVHAGMYRVVSPGQKFGDAPSYFKIGVVNLGIRPVTVAGLMWKFRTLPVKRNWIVIPPVDAASTPIPARLEQGGTAHFLIPEAIFDAESKPVFNVLRGYWFPTYRASLHRVGVYLTTGAEIT